MNEATAALNAQLKAMFPPQVYTCYVCGKHEPTTRDGKCYWALIRCDPQGDPIVVADCCSVTCLRAAPALVGPAVQQKLEGRRLEEEADLTPIPWG